jgi:t-SNARE complex subunit (syntaxin)
VEDIWVNEGWDCFVICITIIIVVVVVLNLVVRKKLTNLSFL